MENEEEERNNENTPDETPENPTNNEENKQGNNEISEPKRENVKRIFNNEKVKTYFKNQKPNFSGNQFTDVIFPPNNESLLYLNSRNELVNDIIMDQVEWKRINEIFPSDNLCLFPSKNENNEIDFQINFNDNNDTLNKHFSSFYHAMSILTSYPNLIEKIFKTKEIKKNGLYELYIYINGEYQILILDDYFPIKNGKLLFSKTKNEEIWILLLEKALAKLYGGYGSLLNCDINLILITFTGLNCERLNLFDSDNEDLENIIRINKQKNLIFVTPSDEGEKNGIMKKKAYQLIEIFDVRTKDENGNEVDLKILKIRNLYEYQNYKGDYSPSSSLLNDDIKRGINYKDDEKYVIYMSIDNLKTNFNKITIIHTMFDCNIKIIKVSNTVNDDSIIGFPQVFNLYIPSNTKVAFSLIIKSNNLNRFTPSNICISEYEPEEKKLINLEGCFNSDENAEFARELDEGYYVIWTYLIKEKCNQTINEYYLKVSSNVYFKLRHQIQDTKFHLIKQMVYNAILQYQGPHMKDNEIYMMEDNYYNYTGLGLKIIINPFDDCYQRWVFQNNMDNMYLLYPYTKIKQFEFIVLPNKGYCLILAMKIDNNKKCEFNMKSYFKTLKYNNQELENPNNYEDFSFIEFCTFDIKDEDVNFSYYDYLTDEGIKKMESQFDPDNIILEHLKSKYPKQMELIQNLESKDKDSDLHFIEKTDLNGNYIGQANKKEEREGRGCFISSDGNSFIGYWKRDKKNNKGSLYDKDFNIILEGNFKNGKMNGKGMKILENGTKYEGNFDNDKINGNGIYTFKNGSKWEGNSTNGLKDGVGKLTDPQGNVKTVEYKNDVLVNNDGNENNYNENAENE